MTDVFSRLHPVLREALISTLRWDTFRAVQEEAIRAFSQGSDLVILAPTAGGKTESGFFPAIDDLLRSGGAGISILYISPLKALINDQLERISRITTPMGIETSAWHGDIGRADRTWLKGEAPGILLTTPESLEVLLSDPIRSPDLAGLRTVIIDEIHAFIGTDRGVHLRCLLDRLEILTGERIQRIGLSATIGNPDHLLEWLSEPTRPHQLVRVPSPPARKRFSFSIEEEEERRFVAVARSIRGKKTLVFVQSRSAAERLHAGLAGLAGPVAVHHSAISSEMRHAAEARMAGEGSACIICTGTLELGIDIGGLDVVVQYGPPDSVASFLQRLGRAGRRGSPAEMAFILSSGEEALIAVAAIEAARHHEAEPLIEPQFPCHVFVQQLLLLLKGTKGMGETAIRRRLLSFPAFAGISHADAGAIISHLLATDYLQKDGDLIAIGPAAEVRLSRSHWIALCSVISARGGYRAVTPDGEVIGTLDPSFIGIALAEGFTLAGRCWRVISSDDERRGLLVIPSDRRGPRPFWVGGGGRGISPLLARSVARVAEERGSDLPLDDAVREAIRDAIFSWPDGIGPDRMMISDEPLPEGSLVSIWTFLGEQQNGTLTHLLRHHLPAGWHIETGPYAVFITTPAGEDGKKAAALALHQIAALTPDDAASRLPLPPVGTWAFDTLLPDDIRRRMALADIYAYPDLVASIRASLPLEET
ncbi:DEAD/DEAH box helicase [Methanocalculus chunghsingensis]|uniref:DEAD/DEAH box helicase n=1 Tax=Methanocalculus chunghsingensis TaxID=156457 RepID=UPI001B8B3891